MADGKRTKDLQKIMIVSLTYNYALNRKGKLIINKYCLNVRRKHFINFQFAQSIDCKYFLTSLLYFRLVMYRMSTT